MKGSCALGECKIRITEAGKASGHIHTGNLPLTHGHQHKLAINSAICRNVSPPYLCNNWLIHLQQCCFSQISTSKSFSTQASILCQGLSVSPLLLAMGSHLPSRRWAKQTQIPVYHLFSQTSSSTNYVNLGHLRSRHQNGTRLHSYGRLLLSNKFFKILT